MQQVFFRMTKTRTQFGRSQWLVRAVTKCLLLALLLTFGATFAAGQAVGVRWDLGAPGGSGVTTVTAGSGYPPIFATPNAGLILCGYPAVGYPCTNTVTTYTDLTLATSCLSNAQIVLQGTNSCVATSDAEGNLGVNLAAGGTYTYNLVVNGVTYPSSGAYVVTIGVAGTASTPVTTPVSCPTSTTFQITSTNQAFAVSLTGNCSASAVTAVAAIIPPALVIFQITEPSGGGDTFSWPSNVIGGCPIATGSNAVTVQAFSWNGTNAIAIGSCNQGTGTQVATIFDATVGFECDNSFGTAGYFLESTGSGCAWAPALNTLTLANASSTGTTLNKLTKLTGTATAVTAATTDTNGIIGITVAGAGTSGKATISQAGEVFCAFDGATTANDWVIPSTTVAGDCEDSSLAPPSLPPPDTQLIGQVLSTNLGAGTYAIDLYGPGLNQPPVTGSGSTRVLQANPTLAGWNCAITSKTTTYTLLASDCNVQASASGGSFTITIPHAIVGNYWKITRTDSTAHVLTIAGDSGNVNGQASITVAPYSSLICHADGTNSWCLTSPGANPLFTQSDSLPSSGTGTFTFTFPIPYSTAPICLCTPLSSGSGGAGSCNLAGAATTTACTINVGDSAVGVYILAVGMP